jgi:hypothetical protein
MTNEKYFLIFRAKCPKIVFEFVCQKMTDEKCRRYHVHFSPREQSPINTYKFQLYIDDYIIWIQSRAQKENLEMLSRNILKIKMKKSDLDLDLDILEAAAKLVMDEDEMPQGDFRFDLKSIKVSIMKKFERN